MKKLIIVVFIVLNSLSFSAEVYRGSGGGGSELQTRLKMEEKVREFERNGYKVISYYYSGGGRVWNYYIYYDKTEKD
ncbi:MAG: hypothetical protein ACRC1T_09610 [Clostridium chrysemydis]|uniref:hypothetical protein n=1 Tax=Clostridium chrysemydis TaxID=2665504 RepID=UPI003F3B5DA0